VNFVTFQLQCRAAVGAIGGEEKNQEGSLSDELFPTVVL
jgi:hypothetical protein